MKKYSQSNNLPSTELKKPKIDHKMLNKEGQRHRAARHRAVGLLSRGVAVILVFVIAFFAFNFLSPSLYGSSTTNIVLQGGGYDESDVILESYHFYSSSSFFDSVEDSFSFVSSFCGILNTLSSPVRWVFDALSGKNVVSDPELSVYVLVSFYSSGNLVAFIVDATDSFNDFGYVEFKPYLTNSFEHRYYNVLLCNIPDVSYMRRGLSMTTFLYNDEYEVVDSTWIFGISNEQFYSYSAALHAYSLLISSE